MNKKFELNTENILKIVGGVVIAAAAVAGVVLTAEQMPEDAGEFVFAPIEEWELFIR